MVVRWFLSRQVPAFLIFLLLPCFSATFADVTTYRFSGNIAHEFYDTTWFPELTDWDPNLGDSIEGAFSFDTSLPVEPSNSQHGVGLVRYAGMPAAVEAIVDGRRFVSSQTELSVRDGLTLDSIGLLTFDVIEMETRQASFTFGLSVIDTDGILVDDLVLPASLEEADEITGWMTIAQTGPGFFFDISELEAITPRVVGDFDANGIVDATDIDLLFDEVKVGQMRQSDGLAPLPSPDFDLNGDYDANSQDVEVLITNLLATTLGDANLDGTVDHLDFEIISGHLFSAGGWAKGDFDGNGLVDGADFNLWNVARVDQQQATVPEPLLGGCGTFFVVFVLARFRSCQRLKIKE